MSSRRRFISGVFRGIERASLRRADDDENPDGEGIPQQAHSGLDMIADGELGTDESAATGAARTGRRRS